MRSTLFFGLFLLAGVAGADDRPNVLFIAVDDLRPELGCYGQPVHSPNIDRLAATGTRFDRAYVQVALCMPSRVSMLTGQRPDTTGVVDFSVRFRDVQPNVVTMPQHFRSHGYHAVAFGKIFHNDDKASWSEPLFTSQRSEDDYHTEFGKQVLAWTREDHRRLTYVWDLGDGITKTKRPGGLSWEAPQVPDNALRDGQIADAAVAKLRELKTGGVPYFVAVGFHKPHLPFIAPKTYFDLYDPKQITLATNPDPPKDAPKFATYNWNDLRHYYGIPDVGPVSPQQARELKHAYYACVSYMDAQVGKVVAEIDRENTIVVLWGDHGWQLGEHGMWDKHSNYETSTRVPLIVCVPPSKGSPHQRFGRDRRPLPDIVGALRIGIAGTSRGDELCAVDGRSNPNLGSRLLSANTDASSQAMERLLGEWGMPFVQTVIDSSSGLFPGRTFAPMNCMTTRQIQMKNVNLANQSKYKSQVALLRQQLRAGWQAAKP